MIGLDIYNINMVIEIRFGIKTQKATIKNGNHFAAVRLKLPPLGVVDMSRFWYPGNGGFSADPNNSLFFGGVLIPSSNEFPSLQSTKYSMRISLSLALISLSLTSLILNPSSLALPPTSLNLVTLPKTITQWTYLHPNVSSWTWSSPLTFFPDWWDGSWSCPRRWPPGSHCAWRSPGFVSCRPAPGGSTSASGAPPSWSTSRPCWPPRGSSCRCRCPWQCWAARRWPAFSWGGESWCQSTWTADQTTIPALLLPATNNFHMYHIQLHESSDALNELLVDLTLVVLVASKLLDLHLQQQQFVGEVIVRLLKFLFAFLLGEGTMFRFGRRIEWRWAWGVIVMVVRWWSVRWVERRNV